MPTRVRSAPNSNALAQSIDALAVAEGTNETRHPGVTTFRVTIPQPPMPTLYDASVIFVGQGSKRGYWRDEVFEYDAARYLVLTSPMPMLREIDATRVLPVLSMAIEIDTTQLGDLLLDVGESASRESTIEPRGVYSADLTPDIENAAVRLLRCLRHDETTKVLAQQTIREILYYVLQGPHGGSLLTLSRSNRVALHLTRVVRHMNEHFGEPLVIQQLADMAHMSVPTFHHHFRSMTSVTPLQYLKAVRLTKARALMIQSGLGAAAAAHEVGYESASQFSREFRRYFGATPVEETAKSQKALAKTKKSS